MNLYRVSEVTRHIKDLLDGDGALQDIWIEGEVSNFSRSSAGHLYFTLKDESSQIRCVMWRSRAAQQSCLPRNGEALLAHGYVSVYEPQGVYQFYADLLQPAGVGALHLAFEALKAKLEAEGLFDPARKRALPRFPRCIGVVTSPQAAALRDILRVLRTRYPLVEVILSPTLVQGTEAPGQIVQALQALNARDDVDVIIIARGGGSLEELWAFNDEQVARAVAASRVPVVSGVGHETDFTIVDFVADVRAPTPTGAAAAVVPDRSELWTVVQHHEVRLLNRMQERLTTLRRTLDGETRALRRYTPQSQIAAYRQRTDELVTRASYLMLHRLQLARERLHGLSAQVSSLNPKGVLARGYAIVRHGRTGTVVSSVQHVRAGDPLAVQVQDGTFGATVGRQGQLGL